MGSSHYKLPYEIINPVWARLSKPAAAVLLVLGSFANKHTKQCFPSKKRIGELTGIEDPRTITRGINRLLTEGLITKWRVKRKGKWPLTVYKLKGKAICGKGKTHFIFNEKMRDRWHELTLSEIKIYTVLAMRASINKANEFDNSCGFRAFGKMMRGEVIRLAGVCEKTVYNGLEGLQDKGWIELFVADIGEMSYAIRILG